MRISHLRQLHPNTIYKWFFDYYGLRQIRDLHPAIYDNVVCHLRSEVARYHDCYLAAYQSATKATITQPTAKAHPLASFDFSSFGQNLYAVAKHISYLEKEWNDTLSPALKLLNYNARHNVDEHLRAANIHLQNYLQVFELMRTKPKPEQPQQPQLALKP